MIRSNIIQYRTINNIYIYIYMYIYIYIYIGYSISCIKGNIKQYHIDYVIYYDVV